MQAWFFWAISMKYIKGNNRCSGGEFQRESANPFSQRFSPVNAGVSELIIVIRKKNHIKENVKQTN